MFTITKADDLGFESLYELIYQNMYQLQSELGLAWNTENIKNHYRKKDNWLLKIDEVIVGGFSIEAMENCLFIHSLQIAETEQGGTLGYRAFKHIIKQAHSLQASFIKCCVFDNNKAKELYSSIGFEQLNISKGILELQLDLKDKNNIFLRRLNKLQRQS
ncbi:acetyltransferase (GNAT) family protein [Sinobacterium caligoides]|uniref:Acetyltransferase (GNAT) family protein n=1 Tax=Sinobacterium caligoides TaxID=933926 RepID=A0A3N2DDM3_9GAMM|nr:GNAT family N-acetyltransferase [Sinobacterium caligoides]ROR97895.1 acetyltransferase (GNAT) family protein [Sinobacterium caligoides]